MSSTPFIQSVLPHSAFDLSRSMPGTERIATSAPEGSTAAEQEASAVSLSPQALARTRTEALAAVQAVAETPEIPAQDAALFSSLAQAEAAGIDTNHSIFTDRSSALDALALASVALAAEPNPEQAMSLLDAFHAVMRAPLAELEPQTPPSHPLVRQMKLARIRESLLPPSADMRARQLIDACLQQFLARNPELAQSQRATDAAADSARA
jgi:hypothetical protein